jgi:CBS domain-containing membrane protein
MGASAVIVFIIPNSPLAQPWPLVGGQIISTIAGVASAQFIADKAFASAVAVGGSVLAMFLLRCLHPPGAASALTPVMAGDPVTSALGYSFVLMPVGLNVAIMLLMALVINRLCLQHKYPAGMGHSSDRKEFSQNIPVDSAQHYGISEQDLEQALQNRDSFIDVSSDDLSLLLSDAQKLSFKRFRGHFTCADIMDSNVYSVEYGTDVEEAWQLMHRENLKALPVIDRSRRVIGIITWHDFFKFITVGKKDTFQQKFRAFIRRTPDISTNKPESVGHIMTAPVTVLTSNTHIVDLIPLMSDKGYRQIPIVNDENRLVGMVNQANLIASLYNESHDFIERKPPVV